MGRLGRPSNDTEANRAFGVLGHNGTDWGWGQGDGVCAMADGIVSDISWSTGYGMTITVDHGRLIDGKVTETRYRHIDRDGVLVSLYESVRRGGQNIAEMGSSGSYAKGVKHLHTELLLDGKLADEQLYQKERDVKPNARQIAPGGAKRREQPTVAVSDNYDPSESYPAGEWVEWDGFIRSTMKGGSDDGDNIWLVKDGLYTKWTTTVAVPGDGALAGIKDLGTYGQSSLPATKPPVVTVPAGNGATLAEVKALIAASEKRILDAIARVPAAVITEQKLPGN
jgi:hypothetical protein